MIRKVIIGEGIDDAISVEFGNGTLSLGRIENRKDHDLFAIGIKQIPKQDIGTKSGDDCKIIEDPPEIILHFLNVAGLDVLLEHIQKVRALLVEFESKEEKK